MIRAFTVNSIVCCQNKDPKSIKNLKDKCTNKKQNDIKLLQNIKTSEINRTKNIIHEHKDLVNHFYEDLKDLHDEIVEEPVKIVEINNDDETFFK